LRLGEKKTQSLKNKKKKTVSPGKSEGGKNDQGSSFTWGKYDRFPAPRRKKQSDLISKRSEERKNPETFKVYWP